MSLAFFLRKNLERVPYRLGRILSYIPFSLRPGLGRVYSKSKSNIRKFSTMNEELKKAYLFSKLKAITVHAFENIPFYQELYNSKNFNPHKDLVFFDDINKIPIINKKMLLEYSIEKRSFRTDKGLLSNTGGSTGTPLSFYTPSCKMGIEWAHIHHIWNKQLGFKSEELKLLMVGRSNVQDFLDYDFIRNSLRVDIYSNFTAIFNKLKTRYRKAIISYIHGYPSAIYELALFCEVNPVHKKTISKNLKGIFLVSEYCHPKERVFIENIFGVKSYSFYGHSEGCVIAAENLNGMYTPYHTYGFCEVKEIEKQKVLLGTNYYNKLSPLIRYNTEDVIENTIVENGILKSFSINQGREGDYILDKNKKKIPLTGLIFGRHHQIFDYCTHIQVRQDSAGFAEILYVRKTKLPKAPNLLFDSKSVEIEFKFTQIESPLKPNSGKLRLLVD